MTSPSRPSWDKYFLDIADMVATRSKDPRTKVGAVLVRDRRIIGTGYNGFPSGVQDWHESRWEPPEKYVWVAHAERNAIDMCARDGVATKGATLYVTLPPCNECAKSIIQCGISTVVVGNPAPAHWQNGVSIAESMLREAVVSIQFAYLRDL
jgi:dCMP deaminase